MIDYHVENAAPEHDTISIDLDNEGYSPVNVTVSRDEHGKVSVAITPYKGETEWHVLGENLGAQRV